MRAATWNVSNMVRWWTLYTDEKMTPVVLKRRGGSARMQGAIVVSTKSPLHIGHADVNFKLSKVK